MKRFNLRLTLLGIGAMNSSRYAPAGLLVAYGRHRIMLDGVPSAVPSGKLDAWLVSDERGELMGEIRKLPPRLLNRKLPLTQLTASQSAIAGKICVSSFLL